MIRLKSNFAGSFYPANPQQLKDQIRRYLSVPLKVIPQPAAILVPHAGIIYSGPTAAYAYKQIEQSSFTRVIILGPSHQVYHTSLSLPDSNGVQTPLGNLDFDLDLIQELCTAKPFKLDNSPHLQEHSIEVQYPFLQLTLPNQLQVIPISVGALEGDALIAGATQLAPLLDDKTLLVISTDLSHFHSQRTAEVLDRTTLNHIINFDTDGLVNSYHRKAAECCGIYPILLGLTILRMRQCQTASLLHYDTSASTSLDDHRVVGYAAIAFH